MTVIQHVEVSEANNAFAGVEPLYRVGRCQCGRELRFFRRTWEMLLACSRRRETRAACGPDGHVIVLNQGQIDRIECQNLLSDILKSDRIPLHRAVKND